MVRSILLYFFTSLLLTSYSQTIDSLEYDLFLDKLKEDVLSDPKFMELVSEEKLNDLINKELPFFSIEDRRGTSIISDILKGKPSIILFWNSYCQYCLDLIPTMNTIHEKYGSLMNVITITSDDIVEIEPYIDLHNFIIYHLVNAQNYSQDLGVKFFPKVILIDERLVVRNIWNKGSFRDFSKEPLLDFISKKIDLLLESK